MPKALGDIRGISYIYPILYGFGIIEVPESVAFKMNTFAVSSLVHSGDLRYNFIDSLFQAQYILYEEDAR